MYTEAVLYSCHAITLLRLTIPAQTTRCQYRLAKCITALYVQYARESIPIPSVNVVIKITHGYKEIRRSWQRKVLESHCLLFTSRRSRFKDL